ncbi:MAG: response regulator [Candidatus Vogelbacteria bacterium]|nr:response regulator [Candidatus Vogelbacteria bacterium]
MENEEAVNKKVLIVEEVEDDVSIRNILRDTLMAEGFGVLDAKNGEEGLDIALQYHPDLILLDIVMPKMNGLAMLKKLREDEWGKTARVIILTNYDDNEKIAEAMGNEVFQYLIKSDIKLESLIKMIKSKIPKA